VTKKRLTADNYLNFLTNELRILMEGVTGGKDQDLLPAHWGVSTFA
jgi:hypothetical protein